MNAILGSEGRIITSSKGRYLFNFPSHVVIFNANVHTEEDGKIWHGDLDLTIDYPDLVRLSKKLNKKIYVLDERVTNIHEADLIVEGDNITGSLRQREEEEDT